MSLMQWPAIIRNNKRPVLHRQANLHGVHFDVWDRALDIIGMIEKAGPAAARPDGMTGRPKSRFDQCPARYSLQMVDHLLRGVFVFTDNQVHVIGHNSAGVTGVPLLRDDVAKCTHDTFNCIITNLQQPMPENRSGLFIKRSHITRRRLDVLAAMVHVAKISNSIPPDRV